MSTLWKNSLHRTTRIPRGSIILARQLANALFVFAYYLLSFILWIIALPYLFFLSRKTKYKHSIPARFFNIRNPKFDPSDIWFHTVSLGETMALVPLIEKLNRTFSISTTTNTGFAYAQKLTPNARFLPYELFLPFWVKKHRTLVVLEAELWFMLFFMAKMEGMHTILLNARISDKSYASYKKFAWFYRFIFKHIDTVYAQTQTDASRLKSLGASHIKITGNIKLSSVPKVTQVYTKPNTTLITAASTHEGEEKLVLDAFHKKLGKLIIVPRHPERFLSVHELIKKHAKLHHMSYTRWSEHKTFDADIILIDAMGELNNIYAISDTVILGGAFASIGGHNPLEPAYFNTAIISGKHYFNQKDTFSAVDNIHVIDEKDLADTLEKTLPKTKINISIDLAHIIADIER